jgi:hypothetical protein
MLDLFSRRAVGWAQARATDTIPALTRCRWLDTRGSLWLGLITTPGASPYASADYRAGAPCSLHPEKHEPEG